MDDPYLTQLKDQRHTLEAMLQADAAVSKPKAGAHFRIVVQIYSRLLQDAFKTVNALIQHLERKSGGNLTLPVSQTALDQQMPPDLPE
jgi:hypothetical protein